jgi:hypothetical protein
LVLTNPGVTPDDSTRVVFLSVRASATTDARYVVETIYESAVRLIARLRTLAKHAPGVNISDHQQAVIGQ